MIDPPQGQDPTEPPIRRAVVVGNQDGGTVAICDLLAMNAI